MNFILTVSLLCTVTGALGDSNRLDKGIGITADFNSFVDPNYVLQEKFVGWGTSLAWWADVVGGMEEDVVEHVVDALFSPSKLNLNILRYVIGGTTPNNYTCGPYRDGAASESFKDGPDSPYNWERDLRQRKIMQMAIEKGADLFEAFSNSPPQWLTISGCSKGNNLRPPLHPNFDAVNADAFADYATEVIKYFHDNLNISFSTYSPFNEAFGLHGIGSWAGSLSEQEGCNMDRETMVSVVQSVYNAINEKGLSYVKLAIADETQVNTQILTYDYFVQAGVGQMFDQVNVHGYWDNIEVSRKDVLSLRTTNAGQDLWMDEMGWGGTPADNMEQGLNIANRIVVDLRRMLPSAWVYWQVVEDSSWGVLDVPYVDTTVEGIIYNSGYYAMAQFSQHIKRGHQLIYISDENSVAAINPEDQELVIVTVNPDTTEVSHEYDLSLFDSIDSVALYRTSSAEQHLNLPPPTVSVERKVTLQTPGESVSTLIVSGVTASVTPNLVQNGDFESVESVNGTLLPVGWEVVGVDGNAVASENAWRGEYSGSFTTGGTERHALTQNITLAKHLSDKVTAQRVPCNFYLSAWCFSAAFGTRFGVNINGEPGPYIEVTRLGLYTGYGVSFAANTEDNIQVYFANDVASIDVLAKIDNIVLHSKCESA